MRQLDGQLSERAQVRLGRSALVYREETGRYVLEREGREPLDIGGTRPEAEASLRALHQAARRDG